MLSAIGGLAKVVGRGWRRLDIRLRNPGSPCLTLNFHAI